MSGGTLVYEYGVLAMIAIAVPLLCYYLIRYYVQGKEALHLTTFAAVLSLSAALLALFVIPVDVYSVGASIDSSTGLQDHPAKLESDQATVKLLYYIIYGVLLFVAFWLLPFGYFYFEEEQAEGGSNSNGSGGSRVCAALKYSVAFVIIFAVLLSLGIILKNSNFDTDDDTDGDKNNQWVGRLKGSFGTLDSIMSFCIASLACLGTIGFVTYTAYGLAFVPLMLIKSRGGAGAGIFGSRATPQELEQQLLATRQEIEFLSKRQALSNTGSSASEEAEMKRHVEEERRLEGELGALLDSRKEEHENATRGRCVNLLWGCCLPLRYTVGFAALALSLTVVVTFALSTLDKMRNSHCGASCGFHLSHAELPNPIDSSLVHLTPFFPLDLIAFLLLVTYLAACTVSGLISLGVRFFCCRVYSIAAGRSAPHALLLGIWLLVFVALTINYELLSLAPSYLTYGRQFVVLDSGERTHCTTAIHVNASLVHGECVMSQISSFINDTQLSMPFFGVVFYYVTYLFCAAFLLSFCLVLCRKAPHPYARVDEGDSDLDDGFSYEELERAGINPYPMQ